MWYSGNGGSVPGVPFGSAYYPKQNIGTAVLNDGPFALGLTMTVNGGKKEKKKQRVLILGVVVLKRRSPQLSTQIKGS